MRVLTLEGYTVSCRWRYDEKDVIRNGEKVGTAPRTTCYIEKDGIPIADASVVLWHKDEFDKEFARKESLKKVLLEKLYPIKVPVLIIANGTAVQVHPGDSEEHISNMKTGRKIFWDAYRNRIPKKEEKEKIEKVIEPAL